MPAKSAAQYRAMAAAAAGKSKLGIPASVGREFVAATPRPGQLKARVGKPIRRLSLRQPARMGESSMRGL